MDKNTLNVAMAQLNYTIADFSGNVAKISAAITRSSGADLVVFSELSLSGYYPQDMLETDAFRNAEKAAIDQIVQLSIQTDAIIIIGATTQNRKAGKPLFNAILAIHNGRIVGEYRKQLLPTYNIFDERRHFEVGDLEPLVLEIKGNRVGFLICEDSWNDESRDYANNPVEQVARLGIDLLVSVNASPSNVGKEGVRRDLFAAIAKKYQFSIVYVNQVGANDQIVFDGNSFVVDAEGKTVATLPAFEESTGIASFVRADNKRLVLAGTRHGLSREVKKPLPAPEFEYRQALLGLRDYVAKCHFTSVVVGSSGGIDSALTLALAVDALGPENVTAITMPSRLSSEGSVEDSRRLAENLGIRLLEHPIQEIVDAFGSGFQRFVSAPGSHGVTVENIQARIRGSILMEFSNEFGALLLSTGNKSEMSVGYATLYGDMNGGLNLIGDLYKTEVFALAEWYNAKHGRAVIPVEIIQKAPSAELSEGQKDSDSLPPYPVLDAILKWHIENDSLDFDLMYGQLSTALVMKVIAMVNKAEFKRRQAPPIIRLRPRAFGNGRQMPIAARYA